MYTWTDKKNKVNKLKHGFYFDEIEDVFDDPHLIEWYDMVHSSLDEDRYICLGCLHNTMVLYIVYEDRKNGDVQLISAREAEPQEERLYYEHYRRET